MRDLLVMQIKEVNDEVGFNFTTNGSPIEIMTGLSVFLDAMSTDIDIPFNEMLAMIAIINEEDDIDG